MNILFAPLTESIKDVVLSFVQRKPRKFGETWTDGNRLCMGIFTIAMWVNDDLFVCHHNYNEATRQRLNVIPSIDITIERHLWHLNGQAWPIGAKWNAIVRPKSQKIKRLKKLKYCKSG